MGRDKEWISTAAGAVFRRIRVSVRVSIRNKVRLVLGLGLVYGLVLGLPPSSN